MSVYVYVCMYDCRARGCLAHSGMCHESMGQVKVRIDMTYDDSKQTSKESWTEGRRADSQKNTEAEEQRNWTEAAKRSLYKKNKIEVNNWITATTRARTNRQKNGKPRSQKENTPKRTKRKQLFSVNMVCHGLSFMRLTHHRLIWPGQSQPVCWSRLLRNGKKSVKTQQFPSFGGLCAVPRHKICTLYPTSLPGGNQAWLGL